MTDGCTIFLFKFLYHEKILRSYFKAMRFCSSQNRLDFPRYFNKDEMNNVILKIKKKKKSGAEVFVNPYLALCLKLKIITCNRFLCGSRYDTQTGRRRFYIRLRNNEMLVSVSFIVIITYTIIYKN